VKPSGQIKESTVVGLVVDEGNEGEQDLVLIGLREQPTHCWLCSAVTHA
jgi:hypothetical protein